MYCNKCGTRLRKNSNFCHVCGNKVSEVEIYIRKSEDPIPDQLSMGEMFDKPDFKKLEQREGRFLDVLRSFRIKKDRPHVPLEGDNEVSLKLNSPIEEKPEAIELDFSDINEFPDKAITPKEKDFEEFVAPPFEINNKSSIQQKVEDFDEIEKSNEKISLPKEPSLFKRFFEYMKEDEVYDGNILDRKSSQSKDEELELADAQIISSDDDVLESVSLEESVVIDASESDVESMDIDSEPELEIDEVTEKSPSIFAKLKSFLEEKDEDNLLDLSPDEYSDLVYGQGKLEDLKEEPIFEIKDEDELEKDFQEFEIPEFDGKDKDEIETKISPEEVKEKPSFINSIIGFFGKSKKDEKDEENLEDYTEEDKFEEEKPYTTKSTFSYTDTEKTIRYSKTVIDSYLGKAERGELDLDNLDSIEELPLEEVIETDKKEPVEPVIKDEPFVEDVADEIVIDDSLFIEVEPSEETEDDTHYEELIVDKRKIDDEKLDFEAVEEAPPLIKKEKTPGIISNVADFFKSIPQFFTATSKDKEDGKEKDNIDIILNSPVTSEDTMPLVLSREELEILNKEIDKRQRGSMKEQVLKRTNVRVAPVMRKMINLGAKLTIPLFIIVLSLACWTISWAISNPIFIGILGIIKFFILYLTISLATNSAFNSIGLRLKRSVVSLFIFLQMLVYQILDAVYIRLTFVEGQTVEALLHVLSPKIFTILFFVLLAFLLLVFNYKKIKERRGTLVFVGWYIVISTTVTLVIILLELFFFTILYSLFKEALFQ